MTSRLVPPGPGTLRTLPGLRVCTGPWLRVLAALIGAALTGCAALTNPVVDGIPVHRLPPELLGHSKNDLVTIPLTELQQAPPPVYKLDAGDILGVYIQGTFLGGERIAPGAPPSGPPVHFTDTALQPPSLGYPVEIRRDGTLVLPLIKPISVRGMTVEEAQDTISRAYVEAKILQPGGERVLVSLMRKRAIRVMLVRQELGGFNTGPLGFVGLSVLGGSTKRGSAHILELPAYENDVLNALNRTGGLPGLDVAEEVIIFRGPSEADRGLLEGELQKKKPQLDTVYAGLSCPIVRIPLRVKPGSPPPPPEAILLHEGDVMYLPYRDLDRFYTGGLLPAGEYILPQDRDLDVIQALSLVHGPFLNGSLAIGGGGNPLSDDQLVPPGGGGTAIVPGFGTPSPSLLTILRRTPWGATVPIRVDLYKALRDPRERILVQPQDVLVLQETPEEALARYLEEHFNFNFTYVLFRSSRGTTGTITGTLPQP